ncbi:type II toxin-antitoxin system RelE/ParE family toxin [Vreelandella stevensii]|uniref:type II toxin-antitoxin system RelE/ParE family toxin n=1 Tax=Vreelandella stevensii TaxID=502821 RepID=UPI0002F44CC6|nr:type II toxin-antitoxin system RelE/ParE family toxin [Halomonas stevensii]
MALTPSLASRFIFHRVLTTVDTQRTANYSYQMIELIKTDVFDGWLRELRDMRARAKIEARVRRLSLGNPGDVKPVGKGVSELRIPYGPGYRVYFMNKGPVIVVLLCGGDKASQSHDIEQAKAIAAQWKE